jgi:acyl-CoA synthetase (AMP-forming)/AMP-acid ligase II
MSLVPSLVHQLVHHPRFKTTDMSSVRSIGSGAAHLPPQLADELYTRFPDMGSITEGAFFPACMRITARPFTFSGYGLSEFVSDLSHYNLADLTA